MRTQTSRKWLNEAYWFLNRFYLLYYIFAAMLVVDFVACCLPKNVKPSWAGFDAFAIAITLTFAIMAFCCLCGAFIMLMVAQRLSSRIR